MTGRQFLKMLLLLVFSHLANSPFCKLYCWLPLFQSINAILDLKLYIVQNSLRITCSTCQNMGSLLLQSVSVLFTQFLPKNQSENILHCLINKSPMSPKLTGSLALAEIKVSMILQLVPYTETPHSRILWGWSPFSFPAPRAFHWLGAVYIQIRDFFLTKGNVFRGAFFFSFFFFFLTCIFNATLAETFLKQLL